MEAGQQIRDYVLDKLIGTGGAGQVWRAEHVHLEATAAIKAMHPHFSSNEELRQRFLREAQIMFRSNHDHLVPVHEFFFESGRYFIVMNYVGGGSLKDLIYKSGRLPLSDTFRIAREVLDALNYAHETHHVIHRDVKPSNILLGPEGRAYLGDFGMALATERRRITVVGTQGGGTPEYMSPEQVSGKPIDRRCNIYSFGVVLYEMLAGRLPFGSREEGTSDYTIMEGHKKRLPSPLDNRGVGAVTERVVLQALTKDPEDRFSSLCGHGGCAH